jgi:hypothetical protein
MQAAVGEAPVLTVDARQHRPSSLDEVILSVKGVFFAEFCLLARISQIK